MGIEKHGTCIGHGIFGLSFFVITSKMNTCDICGLTWLNRRQLLNHLDSHKQKTFTCGQCKKKLSSKSRLDEHINQAHTKKPSVVNVVLNFPIIHPYIGTQNKLMKV